MLGHQSIYSKLTILNLDFFWLHNTSRIKLNIKLVGYVIKELKTKIMVVHDLQRSLMALLIFSVALTLATIAVPCFILLLDLVDCWQSCLCLSSKTNHDFSGSRASLQTPAYQMLFVPRSTRFREWQNEFRSSTLNNKFNQQTCNITKKNNTKKIQLDESYSKFK